MCWSGHVSGWRKSWHQTGWWVPGRLGNPCHMEGTQPGSCPTELSAPVLNPLGSSPSTLSVPEETQGSLWSNSSLFLALEKNQGQEFLSSIYIEIVILCYIAILSFLFFFLFLEVWPLFYFVLMERKSLIYFCYQIHQSVHLMPS